MGKQVFNYPFSIQPVAWAAVFLIPHKLTKQECTAEAIAPRRFCTYKLWNHGLQSVVQYQEAPGDFNLIKNWLFLLLSTIRIDYYLWALPGIRELRLSDQQLQGNTTKPNLKTDKNHHCRCRKGKRRRYSLAVNVMSCPNSVIKDIPKQALSVCKLPKNSGAVLGRRWRTDYTSVAATP